MNNRMDLACQIDDILPRRERFPNDDEWLAAVSQRVNSFTGVRIPVPRLEEMWERVSPESSELGSFLLAGRIVEELERFGPWPKEGADIMAPVTGFILRCDSEDARKTFMLTLGALRRVLPRPVSGEGESSWLNRVRDSVRETTDSDIDVEQLEHLWREARVASKHHGGDVWGPSLGYYALLLTEALLRKHGCDVQVWF